MLKHSENLDAKDKVKLDLYKILRMNVLLNQDSADLETLNKFKESSINLDIMLNEEYNKNLDDMFYTTSTLEEEVDRLKKLITLINDRIEQRKSLLSDYRNVTNRELNNLEYIDKSNNLDLYIKRLNSIKTYLDNSNLLELNEKELKYLNEELSKSFDVKSRNEEKNIKLEDELYDNFINVLYDINAKNIIESENLDKDIELIQQEIHESKDQMDTFVTAFDNLKSSGISGELEIEYASYVENSKKNYYFIKEKEILLKLFKLIKEKETDYTNLFTKRSEVSDLLKERQLLRKNSNIREKDKLANLFEMVEEQNQDILLEKKAIDNINVLTERVKLKENRLDYLNKAIKEPEILSILKEYGLIDTYEQEEIPQSEENSKSDEIILSEENQQNLEDKLEVNDLKLDDILKSDIEKEQVIQNNNLNIVEEIKDNEIKLCTSVPTMNYGLSRLKSISVMKRVADMLGVKVKKEYPKVEQPKKDDMFWTEEEINNIVTDLNKKPIEETNKAEEVKLPLDTLFSELTSNPQQEQSITNTPEINSNNIFEENNNLLFPEPVLNSNPLPENKDDKFMWPESAENFDINGIFPN